GRPAPTIAMLLAPGPPTMDPVSLCRALDRFEAWLLVHRIPLSDLNAGNLAVVERDGEPWLMCVDLKSTLSGRELVPLSRWSWTLMQRKLLRRCQRLRQRIGASAGGTALADRPGLPQPARFRPSAAFVATGSDRESPPPDVPFRHFPLPRPACLRPRRRPGTAGRRGAGGRDRGPVRGPGERRDAGDVPGDD